MKKNQKTDKTNQSEKYGPSPLAGVLPVLWRMEKIKQWHREWLKTRSVEMLKR